MIFTDETWKYFASIPYKIRVAMAESKSDIPFSYQDEPFHQAYAILQKTWTKRVSQREAAQLVNIGRDKIKQWDNSFSEYGAMGLLTELSNVKVDPRLEKLVVLIKASRPHESASMALRLADALEIPGAIVRGVDHHRLFVDAKLSERVQDLADRPVDFFDRIAV